MTVYRPDLIPLPFVLITCKFSKTVAKLNLSQLNQYGKEGGRLKAAAPARLYDHNTKHATSDNADTLRSKRNCLNKSVHPKLCASFPLFK
jgi:hypothetical protein